MRTINDTFSSERGAIGFVLILFAGFILCALILGFFAGTNPHIKTLPILGPKISVNAVSPIISKARSACGVVIYSPKENEVFSPKVPIQGGVYNCDPETFRGAIAYFYIAGEGPNDIARILTTPVPLRIWVKGSDSRPTPFALKLPEPDFEDFTRGFIIIETKSREGDNLTERSFHPVRFSR